MIEVKYLQDCKGAAKFGNCMGCGKVSKDDPRMVRLNFRFDIGNGTRGTTVCLCDQCRAELYLKI